MLKTVCKRCTRDARLGARCACGETEQVRVYEMEFGKKSRVPADELGMPIPRMTVTNVDGDHRNTMMFKIGVGATVEAPLPAAEPVMPAPPPPERKVYRCTKGHAWEVLPTQHRDDGTFSLSLDSRDPDVKRCARCLLDLLGKVEVVE